MRVAPLNPKRTIPLLFKTGGALLFGGYLYFQFSQYLSGPIIKSFSLPSYTSTTSDVITVSGELKNADFIWLDGRQIFMDRSGRFSEDLVLVPGYTVRTLRVKDRYGRVVSHEFGLFLDQPDPHDSYALRTQSQKATTSTSTIETSSSNAEREASYLTSITTHGNNEENNNQE